ncbi:hypothetical protein OE88DRAFT_1344804 [Heliocybe sulcata]|uniref:Uncharacterized protein n=1 Tax=Heliocybe sulcata TaxID=5364 RepID=A0A5C3N5P1_9AGAM|nr:hypothetical protein OE88DRAFT_1344804 [Heliocybe sulcata]
MFEIIIMSHPPPSVVRLIILTQNSRLPFNPCLSRMPFHRPPDKEFIIQVKALHKDFQDGNFSKFRKGFVTFLHRPNISADILGIDEYAIGYCCTSVMIQALARPRECFEDLQTRALCADLLRDITTKTKRITLSPPKDLMLYDEDGQSAFRNREYLFGCSDVWEGSSRVRTLAEELLMGFGNPSTRWFSAWDTKVRIRQRLYREGMKPNPSHNHTHSESASCDDSCTWTLCPQGTPCDTNPGP